MLSASFGSALSIGGAESDAVFDIAADSAGNSYVTGYFSGTADFDHTQTHLGDADILTARGSTDAFVAKYAPDDSLLWVRRMGGDTLRLGAITDVGRDIALDAAGNVYVVGEFEESADFGATTLASAGSKDGFLAKFDTTGNLHWATQWGTTATDRGYGVGVDSQGSVYALGFRFAAGYDILKFSSSGASVWSRSIVDDGAASGDMAVSSTGDVFIAGSFDGIVDFDPSSKVKNVSAGSSDASFVLKLDANGKFGWVSPFVGQISGGTVGQVYASAVTLDDSGNVIVGGSYSNTVDFDPGKGTTTLPTIGGGFIAKLNGRGGLVWARAFEGGSSVEGLDVDAAGSVYATGSFRSSIDLHPGSAIHTRTSAGESDVFIVKLTASGDFVWGEAIGGSGSDIGWGIAVDDAGVVHVAGYYTDVVDFNPDPLGTHFLGTEGARRDGFRLRLLQP